LKSARLPSKALEVLRRERHGAHAAASFSPEHDDAVLVENRHRQRPAQYRVSDGENRDGQRDAAGQNDHHCRRGFPFTDRPPAAEPNVFAGIWPPSRQQHGDIIG
jgi:hypothetical protein